MRTDPPQRAEHAFSYPPTLSGPLVVVVSSRAMSRKLAALQFAGCSNLHRMVLSPSSSCPKLTTVNLSGCTGLQYVLLQSMSLQSVNLSDCPVLAKVR